MAHLTASRALGYSTRNASPMVFTSTPPCLAMIGRTSPRCSSSSCSASSSFACPSAVNPTRSVNMIAASLLSAWLISCLRLLLRHKCSYRTALYCKAEPLDERLGPPHLDQEPDPLRRHPVCPILALLVNLDQPL